MPVPTSSLAIDALQGPVPARSFIAAAKKATGKDFGRLILTHHHGDHVNGNQFFTRAEILSHPYCQSEVLKAIPNTPKMWNPTPGVADVAEERRLVPPTVTFKDDLVYDIGGTEVQFRCVGPAHTWGDVVAYLPQHKIVFLGDVGFFWVAPYANNSYITKWIDVCNAILGWDVDVLVPGHGPIGGKKELAEMAEYFQVLGVEARKRYDAKMTPAPPPPKSGWAGSTTGLARSGSSWTRSGGTPEWNGTPDAGLQRQRGSRGDDRYNEVKARAKKVSEMIPLDRMDALAEEV